MSIIMSSHFPQFSNKAAAALNFTSLVWRRPPDRLLGAAQLERIGRHMDARRALLDAKCREHGLDRPGNDSLHRPNAWEFLVNRQHHLIWCNVFKAASSSWMYNFNILAGYSAQYLRKTNVVSLSLARRKYARVTFAELQRAQNDSLTFLIVRHPFERLLSAYRDKFMFAVPHSLHDRLGAQIIKKYRHSAVVVGCGCSQQISKNLVIKTRLCLLIRSATPGPNGRPSGRRSPSSWRSCWTSRKPLRSICTGRRSRSSARRARSTST